MYVASCGPVLNALNSHSLKNFFTTVKALLSQARADAAQSDSRHYYEVPEAELSTRHVIFIDV
jgi:hypothetical protein